MISLSQRQRIFLCLIICALLLPIVPDPAFMAHAAPKPSRDNDSVSVLAPRDEQVLTTITVMATGYTAGYESTGKRPNHPLYGITFSGVKVRRDKNSLSTIAADPEIFPLGSILYIPGYGYGIVADTGSAIKGKKIDLYFSTIKQVYREWGKKEVDVQIIKLGNGKCTEKMVAQFRKAIEVHKTIPPEILDETVNM
jgi:3D (Asp-Asp-Asp) domain-containing protein